MARVQINSSNAKFAVLPGVSTATFTTPDLSVTGSQSISFTVALSDFTPAADVTLVDKSAGNDGFIIKWLTTDKVRLVIGDGASLTNVDVVAASGFANGTKHAVTIAWADGVGATFSYDGVVSGAQVAAVKTLTNAAAVLTIGSATSVGNVYALTIGSLYNFNPNLSTTAQTFTAATGEVWTTNGTARIFGNTNATYGIPAQWDAGGPFGEYADPAQTDVLGTTAAIRRIMTDVGWVSGGGGVTVGSATGADGVASAAASLTAAGANGTILFTTVLGAAVRTYSALVRRKTGTGTVNITGDNGATWTAITLTTAYAPFYFTTASAANPVVGFRLVTSADAIEVDFNTLVAGSNKFPLFTPINVNQAATVAQYVSAGNLPTNDFTIYGEVIWQQVQPAASYFLFGSYVDASNYTAVLWDGTNLIARKRIAGVNTDATKALTPTANTRIKWAARFSSTTGIDIFHTGAIGTNDATTTAAQIGTNFQIGADGNGANQPFASESNLRIYPVALSSSRLEALTT